MTTRPTPETDATHQAFLSTGAAYTHAIAVVFDDMVKLERDRNALREAMGDKQEPHGPAIDSEHGKDCYGCGLIALSDRRIPMDKAALKPCPASPTSMHIWHGTEQGCRYCGAAFPTIGPVVGQTENRFNKPSPSIEGDCRTQPVPATAPAAMPEEPRSKSMDVVEYGNEWICYAYALRSWATARIAEWKGRYESAITDNHRKTNAATDAIERAEKAEAELAELRKP